MNLEKFSMINYYRGIITNWTRIPLFLWHLVEEYNSWHSTTFSFLLLYLFTFKICFSVLIILSVAVWRWSQVGWGQMSGWRPQSPSSILMRWWRRECCHGLTTRTLDRVIYTSTLYTVELETKIRKFSQSQRGTLQGPSLCWKHLLPLSHLRIYADTMLNER